MLEIDVLTLFPEMITGPLSQSIIGRAAERGLLRVRAHQLRDWTHDRYRRTDDYLCGGGQGMLLKCEPIFEAVEELRREGTRVILMTPQGQVFTQAVARELAAPCLSAAPPPLPPQLPSASAAAAASSAPSVVEVSPLPSADSSSSCASLAIPAVAVSSSASSVASPSPSPTTASPRSSSAAALPPPSPTTAKEGEEGEVAEETGRATAQVGHAHYIILCGHYEGVDQRVIDTLVDRELSIGDYILTNGAIAAVVVIDAVARLLPGALGDERSSEEESFSDGLLEAPAYTKPNVFRGMAVPAVFLSGNHRAIAEWKLEHALARTRANRPDLYEAWAAAHPEHFRPGRKRCRQTQYKPRKEPGASASSSSAEGGNSSGAEGNTADAAE